MTNGDASGGRQVAPTVVQPLLAYLDRVLGRGAVREVLAAAGLGEEVAGDWKRWFSAPQSIAVAEHAARLCGDPDVGRRAGEELFSVSLEHGMGDFVIANGSVPAAIESAVDYGNRMSSGRHLVVRDSRDDDAVVVEATYADPAAGHSFFCGIAAGYYACVPSLFGARGMVAETACQLRGDPRCRYVLHWVPDSRFDPRAEAELDESTARRERMVQRYEELQSTAAELVGADDVDEVLERITRRAGIAVQTPRYLLAVRAHPDDRLRLHHFGFDTDRAASEWADRLLAGEIGPRDGALVVEVASPRNQFGHLAAVGAKGTTFSDIDQRLLEGYAGSAAAALEVVAALGEARRERDTARALRELAEELATVGTRDEIAQRLGVAVPRVTDSDMAAVWLAGDDQLRLASWQGDVPFPSSLPTELVPQEIPGADAALADPRPMLLEAADAPAPLREYFEATGTTTAFLVPLTPHGVFHGFVAAGFHEPVPADRVDDLLERLNGVAHQGATALENARLLEQMRQQALHDALTGLPTRPLLEDRAEQALRRAWRTGRGVGVLFIDLDRFKTVNDSLGHRMGDDLICRVAERLAAVVREGDTLGRLGGDEFVAVLPDIGGPEEAARVAGRIADALEEPIELHGHEISVSCSIGIACAPDHGADYATLLQHADAAMYEAKLRGRGTHALHEPGTRSNRRRMLELEHELYRAVPDGQLQVLYQPRFELVTGMVATVEALARWRHPDLGLLGPGAFHRVAEETGLIVAIDRHVRAAAFAHAAGWARQGNAVRVAVSVSARELNDPNLSARIAGELAAAGLEPHLAELQIPDRAVTDDGPTRMLLTMLADLGVRVAVTGFGTGDSLRSRLAHQGLHAVHIDERFVHEITDSDRETPVLGGLIALARELDLEVAADGVQTLAQRDVLHRLGCALVQGPLFGAPSDATLLEVMLPGGVAAAGLPVAPLAG